MIAILILVVSALCGMAFGYAAQRGSICAVLGVEDWIERHSARQMLAFLRCSVWVIAVSVPLVWLDPDAHLAALQAPSIAAFVGGLLFGIGATINGGCAYGTIIRLGAGDLSFLATLAGMASGFWLELRTGLMNPVPFARSPLETPSTLALLVIGLAIVFCLRELRSMADPASRKRAWTPERAVAVMGLAGGVLHALHGGWAYTVALQEAANFHWSQIAPVLIVILAASSLGAAIAAGAKHRFRLQLGLAHIPARLLGGAIMGVGGAWVPGGNDALILHAVPSLSPHSLVAYPALIAGVAGGLLASKMLRSWTPRRSRRSMVNWKTSGRE